MKTTNVLTLFFFVIVLSHQVNALDQIKRFKANTLDLDFETNYYLSKANYYSNSGGLENLPYDGQFQQISIKPTMRWTLNSDWALNSALSFNRAESRGFNSTDGYYSKANMNLANLQLGTEYRMDWLGFELIPEGTLVLPLEKYSTSNQSVMMNEGAMELKAQLTGQVEISNFKPFAQMGYSYRDQGRASLLHWAIGTEYKFNKMALGADLNGFSSVTDDVDAANFDARRLMSSQANGGSFYYAAVNPTLIQTQVWYRWRMMNLMMKTFFKTSLMGGNAAAGTEIGILARYEIDFNKNKMNKKINNDSQFDDSYFTEDTQDGVNQNIFKAQDPVVQPVKKTAPQYQDDSSQSTDYQIKLKPAKKKKKK